MRLINACFLSLAVFVVQIAVGCESALADDSPTFSGGWITNGPAIFRVVTNSEPPNFGTGTNRPIRRPVSKRASANIVFDHFQPGSLNEVVFREATSLTNGRTTQIWSVRKHPSGWPKIPPLVQWNTNCLLWGLRGFTALSPCWQAEGNPGQVPLTALTRRHAYTRGHGMGPSGFNTNFAGQSAWFLTADNEVVSRKILRDVVRTRNEDDRDYTILLLDRDLSSEIEPILVAETKDLMSRYVAVQRAPWPLLEPEQGGNVNLDLPGFTINAVKGGDSGSPNLIPLFGSLIFLSGRSTSGPSPQMQADMDGLCRLEKLDPQKYQLQWADLSRYPKY
jgi:hypothetical protein